MKVTVCDVCYRTSDGKTLNRATYNISYHKQATKSVLPVCDEHKDFFKDCKNFDEAQQKADDLLIHGKVIEPTKGGGA